MPALPKGCNIAQPNGSFLDTPRNGGVGHERKSGGATLLVGKQSLSSHHAGIPFVKYLPLADICLRFLSSSNRVAGHHCGHADRLAQTN